MLPPQPQMRQATPPRRRHPRPLLPLTPAPSRWPPRPLLRPQPRLHPRLRPQPLGMECGCSRRRSHPRTDGLSCARDRGAAVAAPAGQDLHPQPGPHSWPERHLQPYPQQTAAAVISTAVAATVVAAASVALAAALSARGAAAAAEVVAASATRAAAAASRASKAQWARFL
eukprot:gene13657-biopygen2301